MFDKELGCLWLRKTHSGETYLSGTLDLISQKIKIVAFKNKNKTKENHPDYRILLARDKKDFKDYGELKIEKDNFLP